MVLLGAVDENENVGEGLDGIGVTAHHHVGESDIVVGGDVAGSDTGKQGLLLVQFNVVHHLESQGKVAQQAVDAKQTNNGEVAQHLVQGAGTVLASSLHHVASVLGDQKLLGDAGLLDQRVKDVQHTVAAPDLRVVAKESELLLGLVLDAVAVVAEGLELVDELVNDIPEPLVGELQSNWSLRVYVDVRKIVC